MIHFKCGRETVDCQITGGDTGGAIRCPHIGRWIKHRLLQAPDAVLPNTAFTSWWGAELTRAGAAPDPRISKGQYPNVVRQTAHQKLQ